MLAKDYLNQSKIISKKFYDRKLNPIELKVNDSVYVVNKTLREGVPQSLQPKYKGPYQILELFDNQTALLQIGKNKTKVYHLNLLKPCVSDSESEEEEEES